jgi:nucleoside-diphosphate-sugar epimerase
MRILLTGATGFTGRHFVEAAVAAGHQVVSLRSKLTDKISLQQEVAEAMPEAVVHLAAISFVGYTDEAAFYAVNTVGTTHLLASLAALPHAPAKVLIASSANVYGNCPNSPIDETQPPAPVNHYAMSKLAMEYLARIYLDRLPIVIARPFNYTGPGQTLSFVIPKLVDCYARRLPVIELGNLQVEREFNDVRMVCDAYLSLLNYGQAGEVYNVCSGRSYTLRQVMDILAELTGHQPKVRVNPVFVRINEVCRLCGNAAKLQSLYTRAGKVWWQPDLRETLAWMLSQVVTP